MDIVQFFNFATGCDESDDVIRRPVSASGAGDADADRFFTYLSFVSFYRRVVSIRFKNTRSQSIAVIYSPRDQRASCLVLGTSLENIDTFC